MEMILCRIWHIPEGFATVLLALATILAGSFVIIGAWVAWRSVQRQINSAENIENTRRNNEISAIELGFTSELLAYSRALIQATSIWNKRALQSPSGAPTSNLPILIDPLYYKTNIGKIGVIRQQWVGGALIGFYANLLELNEKAREVFSGQPTVNMTNQSIATRLRLMASNLSQALDGLNADRKFPLQPEIQLNDLFMPDGKPLSQSENVPKNIQEVLLRLAGIASAAPIET